MSKNPLNSHETQFEPEFGYLGSYGPEIFTEST